VLTWQPSRWQKARISAPLSTVTPGPKTTFWPMIASRPITGIQREPDRRRIGQGDAVFQRRARAAGLEDRLGARQFGAGVDAQRLGLVAGDHIDAEPGGARQRRQVGQVIFARGVAVADPGQKFAQKAASAAMTPELTSRIARVASSASLYSTMRSGPSGPVTRRP
jgi:hypothetical protein